MSGSGTDLFQFGLPVPEFHETYPLIRFATTLYFYQFKASATNDEYQNNVILRWLFRGPV